MAERLGYRPGERIHWIQAKLAAADSGGWRVVRLERVEPGRVLVVGCAGGLTRFYCLTDRLRDVLATRRLSSVEPRCLVTINERWHVLALPAHAGSRYLFLDRQRASRCAPRGDREEPYVRFWLIGMSDMARLPAHGTVVRGAALRGQPLEEE